MSAWGIFLYLGLGSLFTSNSTLPKPHPNPIPIDKLTPGKKEIAPPPTKPDSENHYAAREDNFVLGLQLEELNPRIKEVERKHADVVELIEEFDELVSSLLSNEDGRRLASEELARKFEFLRKLPNPSGNLNAKA